MQISLQLSMLRKLILDRYVYGNALTASAYDGTLDILKLLLDHGADVNSNDGWALQIAAAEGNFEIVRELLIRHANVNARTSNPNFPQRTALYGACELGWDKIVDILLECGADPNLGGGEDDYPILAAARDGGSKIINKLILAHADVNVASGDDGSTALILYAENFSELEPLERLIDAGAAIDATNNNGDTALIAAASMYDAEFVNFLLAKGADIMHRNNDGYNAMQVACPLEDAEITDAEITDAERTLSYLINHASFILLEIQREVKRGNQAVVNAVDKARADAKQVNIKNAAKIKARSSHEGDSGAASAGLDPLKDDLEDLHEMHHPEDSQETLFTEKGSDYPKRTDSEYSVASKSREVLGHEFTHQLDGTRNTAPLADKIHKETATSDVLQPESLYNNLHALAGNEYGYPGSSAAVNSTTYGRTDQMRNQALFQKQEYWHAQGKASYNSYSTTPDHNIPQHVSRTGQNETALPQEQGNQGGPVRRKPVASTNDERDHSQNMARGGSPLSRTIPASQQQQQQYRHQYQLGESTVNNSSTQRSKSASPSHDIPHQLQILNQRQPAAQPQFPNQAAPRTASHPPQNQRFDTQHSESAHGNFNQTHTGNMIPVSSHSRYPAPSQPKFSQNDTHHQYPRTLHPGQVHKSTSTPMMQQLQSENDRPLGPKPQFGGNSDRQRSQGDHHQYQYQYNSPSQDESKNPKSGLFDGKVTNTVNTFSQAKGRLFR
jgi:ankyrin repeat protein